MSASDISNIVTRMKSQTTTTLGWDAVVNYSETELNNLLAIAYKQDSAGVRSTKVFQCSLTGVNRDGDDYTIHYKFVLGAPLIQFAAAAYVRPVCSLTIPIIGGLVTAGKKSETVDDGIYTLTLRNLDLALVKGGDDIHHMQVDKPFTFPPNSHGDGKVFLDFPTSKDLVVELGSIGERLGHRIPFIDAHLANLEGEIRNKLRTEYNSICCELPRTNPIKYSSDTIPLVPKLFRFAACTRNLSTSNLKAESILSLFIQTGQKNAGKQRDLDLAWNSLWNITLKCPPIPFGKTASIILEKNALPNLVGNLGALEKKGDTGGLDDINGDLQVQLNTDKAVREGVELKPVGTQMDWSTRARHEKFDVTLPNLQLSVEEDILIDEVRRESQYKIDWSQRDSSGHKRFGAVTIRNTGDETVPPVDLVGGYTLKKNSIKTKNDWKIEVKTDSQDFTAEFRGGDGLDDSSTRGIRKEEGVDISMLTNLLVPNRLEVIKIDPSAGVEVAGGDFYLVGNLKKL